MRVSNMRPTRVNANGLLESLNLDDSCNGAATPGQKPLLAHVDAETPLSAEGQTEFRAVSARSNYVLSDRVDIQYASKECCRFMAKLGTLAEAALKRLGRYILEHKRLVYTFPWQAATHVGM